jgi:hypothetical protein
LDPSKPGVPNYAGQHRYEFGNEIESSVQPAARRIAKDPSFLRRRTFSSTTEALQAGFTAKDIGLVAARADYLRWFGGMKARLRLRTVSPAP